MSPWKRFAGSGAAYVRAIRYADNLKHGSRDIMEKALERGLFCVFVGGKFPVVSLPNRVLEVMMANDEVVRKMSTGDDHGTADLPWFTYEEVMGFSNTPVKKLSEFPTYLFDVVEGSSEPELGEPSTLRPRFAVSIPDLKDTVSDRLLQNHSAIPMQSRIPMFLLPPVEAAIITRTLSMFKWQHVFRYCPRCGSKDLKNPTSSAVLLASHLRQIRAMYTCLAGFMETGETIEETVHREVAEEVGLPLSSFRVVDSQHWPFPDNNLMIGCFATAASADEPSIDEKELRDARWFSVEQLEQAVARIEENPIISLVSPGRRQLVCDYGIVLFVCLIYCCHSAEKQSACNITKGTHSYVWRQVDQNGFHLELTIGVEVMLTKWSTEGRCSALIVHQFPPGMFSSPDELRNLDAFLKHSSFLIPGRVDIESHASNSEGHRVFIFLRMNLTDNLLVGKTRFPARLRYHSPMEVQDDETPLEATVQLPGELFEFCESRFSKPRS
ncbi:unnamed protein product [Cyprideis torosa]|uniref:Phosphatidylinositol-glycan biosynthesis class X protein n=1 Tax=Cyprideis torosa TaxID=163714 RepID=A0A7R8WI57_9CRUS|nr:unnamed protein product [Cyprideis torosa]CAG0894302.1 unnamed protein product [Cyprideis torosa]